MGAIATGGVIDLDEERIHGLGVLATEVQDVIRRETAELERRDCAYRSGRRPLQVRGKTVILVDDGLATGSTMRAAVSALRMLGPARIIAAVPVGSSAACAELGVHADECVCVSTPEPFRAVGAWYRDFTPTTDDEVSAWLRRFGDGGELDTTRMAPENRRST
jgi:predicted phosphoribosyltransferase